MASLGPWLGRGGRDPWFGDMDVWDPFSSFGFGGLVNRGRGSDDDTAALAHAHVDWRETDTAHIFHADLPGVRKEEVKVQVEDNNILQISGERTKEQEESGGDKWHRTERRRGSFMRRFRLPENANMDEIKCTLEHGVLTVVVPKRETPEAQKNVRSINVA